MEHGKRETNIRPEGYIGFKGDRIAYLQGLQDQEVTLNTNQKNELETLLKRKAELGARGCRSAEEETEYSDLITTTVQKD